jgi:hypothetical protein
MGAYGALAVSSESDRLRRRYVTAASLRRETDCLTAVSYKRSFSQVGGSQGDGAEPQRRQIEL